MQQSYEIGRLTTNITSFSWYWMNMKGKLNSMMLYLSYIRGEKAYYEKTKWSLNLYLFVAFQLASENYNSDALVSKYLLNN